jgi:pyrroline-5-carboxylate reductase
MGVAVLSGVIASLESSAADGAPHAAAKWESHTPGTVTPAVAYFDESQPSRFIACVSQQESAARLRGLFIALGGLGPSVEVRVSDNVQAVAEAQVVLLWYGNLVHLSSYRVPISPHIS